jgi:hypothetical protein
VAEVLCKPGAGLGADRLKSAGTIQSQALFQRILALRLDLGGMQEWMPASCRLARMIADRYLRKIEKQPNEE